MMCRYNSALWRQRPRESEKPSTVWEGERGQTPKLQHIFSPSFFAGLRLSHSSREGPTVVVGSWPPCFLAGTSCERGLFPTSLCPSSPAVDELRLLTFSHIFGDQKLKAGTDWTPLSQDLVFRSQYNREGRLKMRGFPLPVPPVTLEDAVRWQPHLAFGHQGLMAPSPLGWRHWFYNFPLAFSPLLESQKFPELESIPSEIQTLLT